MRHLFPKSLLSLPLLLALAAGANAAPEPEWLANEAQRMEAPGPDAEAILLAQGNCAGAAAQAAAQTGGQVLSVSAQQQGGRTVCVVTVLVPGRDGARPRRTTITIPG